MSNAEGTRVIAQSDEAERAAPHKVPETERADAGGSGAESAPFADTERVSDAFEDDFWDIPCEKAGVANYGTDQTGTPDHGTETWAPDRGTGTDTDTPPLGTEESRTPDHGAKPGTETGTAHTVVGEPGAEDHGPKDDGAEDVPDAVREEPDVPAPSGPAELVLTRPRAWPACCGRTSARPISDRAGSGWVRPASGWRPRDSRS
ncbi:hypothetical protein ACFQX6_51875 [Streptosporangium lutulentum]